MKTIRRFSILLAVCAGWALAAEYRVYIGTYTGKGSQGIYTVRFDSKTGKLGAPELAAETVNPSFLAIHPNRRFLYAVSEISGQGGQKGGAVSSFAIDAQTGKLKFLDRVSSRGAGPCYVALDKKSKDVLVANYGSGSVAVLPVNEDGSLREASAFVQHTGSGANPKRQQGPHAHSINASPDDRFVIAADLGLDQLRIYRFDADKGSLDPNQPPFAKVDPGAGPRHFAFHPSGKFAYVINEMGSSVTAFSWDAAAGRLNTLETVSTLPKDFHGDNTTAEVQVHPSGKFLYGSNRGHDSIAVFAIDQRKGTLTPIEQAPSGGKTPRNFGIDPTGAYLFAANQDSGNVVMFRIDARSGRLQPTGQSFQVGSPVCVRFLEMR